MRPTGLVSAGHQQDRCDRSTPLPGAAGSATERPRARALPMRVGALTPTVRTFSPVTSSIRISRSGGAPGTPGACITPPPAPTPRTLTLRSGFAVLDRQQRRLHRHAHAQGHIDLASYLEARTQQHGSPAQLASELGTTTTVVRRLLDTADITPSPRRVTAAHTRRTST